MTHILLDTHTSTITRLTGPYTVNGYTHPLGPLAGEEHILHLEQVEDSRPDYDSRKQRAQRTDWYVDGTQYRRGWLVTDITMADVRSALRSRVDGLARDKRDSVTAGTSPAEMASWALKRSEAMAYTTEPESQSEADSMGVGLIYAEAQARGVPTGNISSRVLANAAALSALEAGIAGNAGKLHDSLAAAESIEAMLDIDIDAGWPI